MGRICVGSVVTGVAGVVFLWVVLQKPRKGRVPVEPGVPVVLRIAPGWLWVQLLPG